MVGVASYTENFPALLDSLFLPTEGGKQVGGSFSGGGRWGGWGATKWREGNIQWEMFECFY